MPQQLDAAFVRRVLDSSPEGIAICAATAPDHPVVYVNTAFEQLTGYSAAEVMGNSLRLLHGSDGEQEGLRKLRDALAKGESCRVLLRNYRKNGELLWNELTLQPMAGTDGRATHFVGYFRDISGRLKQVDKTQEGVPTWLREDRITGLSSRAWFNELMAREWRIARRDQRPLTLALFDVDALGTYNATYGKSAGDACLRRIASIVSGSFRRGSDVVGVWGEGVLAVLAVYRDDTAVSGVIEHAATTVRRVADMHIHHPRSPLHKFVTVTAGLATVRPERDEEDSSRLVERAEKALAEGKRGQRGGLTQAAAD